MLIESRPGRSADAGMATAMTTQTITTAAEDHVKAEEAARRNTVTKLILDSGPKLLVRLFKVWEPHIEQSITYMIFSNRIWRILER